MAEREVDNDKGKGCSINNVHLQLGRIERDRPYVQTTTLSSPEYSYFVLFTLIASACRSTS